MILLWQKYRNSAAEFLIFQIEGKEDGVQVILRLRRASFFLPSGFTLTGITEPSLSSWISSPRSGSRKGVKQGQLVGIQSCQFFTSSPEELAIQSGYLREQFLYFLLQCARLFQ